MEHKIRVVARIAPAPDMRISPGKICLHVDGNRIVSKMGTGQSIAQDFGREKKTSFFNMVLPPLFTCSHTSHVFFVYFNDSFDVDDVFGPDASAEMVFESMRPIVKSMVDGYDGTIFTYGRRMTGKCEQMSLLG